MFVDILGNGELWAEPSSVAYIKEVDYGIRVYMYGHRSPDAYTISITDAVTHYNKVLQEVEGYPPPDSSFIPADFLDLANKGEFTPFPIEPDEPIIGDVGDTDEQR